MQNVHDVFHVHDAAMRVERLDKPAQVRAFELLRQIHEHPDGGHRVLDAVRLVAHLDGKPQPAHADLVNPQLTVIALALLVVKLPRRRVFFSPAQRNASLADSKHGEIIADLRNLAKRSPLEQARSARPPGAGSVTPCPRYVPPPNIFDRQDGVVVRIELQGRAPELKIVPRSEEHTSEL